MNIAIVGQNPINQCLVTELTAAGLTACLIPDVLTIKSIQGEIGAFSIHAGTDKISANWIIITEEPTLEKGFTDIPLVNGPYFSLMDYTIPAKILAHQKPTVILLDYPFESPALMTKVALEKAIQLAKKKQPVMYLAKFIRTTGLELETLYREARLAGVSFLKFQEVSIDPDEANDQFQLRVTADSQSIVVEPGVLLTSDRLAMSPGLQKCAGLFRLKWGAQGCIYGNEPFLYPTRTSRSGISILRTIQGIGIHTDCKTQIRSIIAEINKGGPETFNPNAPARQYAEVDAKKCAFCYTCYRACPHAAMLPDHVNSAMGNLQEACHGCGICAAICPAAAIQMANGLDTVGLETEASKSLMLFCCENSGAIAVREIAASCKEEFGCISVHSICCGGEFSLENLFSALRNHDKVIVLTCMDGACRHFEGNRRAARLVAKAREQLKAANLDENRVQQAGTSVGMVGVVKELIKRF